MFYISTNTAWLWHSWQTDHTMLTVLLCVDCLSDACVQSLPIQKSTCAIFLFWASHVLFLHTRVCCVCASSCVVFLLNYVLFCIVVLCPGLWQCDTVCVLYWRTLEEFSLLTHSVRRLSESLMYLCFCPLAILCSLLAHCCGASSVFAEFVLFCVVVCCTGLCF